VARFEFDVAGRLPPQPVWLTRGTKKFREPDVSPDGRSIVMESDSGGAENLFIMGADGTAMRPLLDDRHTGRLPAWAPDGRAVAFVSLSPRGIATVQPDGTGLRQVSSAPDAFGPVWSPSGDRLALSRNRGGAVIVDVQKPDSPPLAALPALPRGVEGFIVTAWSSDGKRLAGHVLGASGEPSGVLTYDLDSRAFSTVSARGSNPRWMKDNRRLIFTQGDKLLLADVSSKNTRELAALRPLAPAGRLSLSPDGRYVYLSAAAMEADVWLASFE
jgi:Tol biopolymer transport system component